MTVFALPVPSGEGGATVGSRSLQQQQEENKTMLGLSIWANKQTCRSKETHTKGMVFMVDANLHLKLNARGRKCGITSLICVVLEQCYVYFTYFAAVIAAGSFPHHIF